MTHVNKYKINLNDIGEGTMLKFPVEMKFTTLGQTDVINREFVEKEVEKAINPIVDYEKSRFVLKAGGNEVANVSYVMNFLKNNALPPKSFFADIGFNNNDIKYRNNGFIRSFLRLNFYDNDVPSNQRLLFFQTIFNKVTKKDVNNLGQPIGANIFQTRYILKNPIKEPEGFAEGFYLYYYKDEVLENLPKEIFMRAEFNNAKTGKRTSFITVNTPQSIDNILQKLHVKYILKRDATGYFYEIDSTYSSNIEYVADIDDNVNTLNDAGIKVKLYEIQVI